jgi:hypothetical protein
MSQPHDTPLPAVEAIVRRQWPGHDGNVLNRANILLLTPEVLWPIWLPMLQLVLALVASETVGPFSPWGFIEWMLLVTPAVTLVVGMVYQWWYIDYLPTRYFLWRFRREVRTRPDAVVPADDPDAIFIQVIPRTNWRTMLENASDVGFLAFDEDRRLLLFEGDTERWIIPAAYVRSITIEDFCPTTIDRLLRNWYPMVVLRAEVQGKDWEACLAPRQVRFERWGPTGRRWAVGAFADWLRERIGVG